MNKEPKKADLLSWLRDIAYLWYELGVYLDVPVGTLHDIDLSRRGQQGGIQFSDVFDKWEINETSPHTFGNLLECLEKLNCKKYIRVIEEKLRDPEVYVKYSSMEDFCK